MMRERERESERERERERGRWGTGKRINRNEWNGEYLYNKDVMKEGVSLDSPIHSCCCDQSGLYNHVSAGYSHLIWSIWQTS